MTTTSSGDLNALTAIHIAKVTTARISASGDGQEDNDLNAKEQAGASHRSISTCWPADQRRQLPRRALIRSDRHDEKINGENSNFPMTKNTYPGTAPQGPDSSVGAGIPSFYVSPTPSMAVDDDNQNVSRDQQNIDSDTLQGFPVSVPAFVPGSFHFQYQPTDLGGVEMTLIRDADQVQEDGLGFRKGSA